MGQDYLVEKILADARASAKDIISAAQKMAKENIAGANKRATEILEDAKATAKRNKERENEINAGQEILRARLAALNEQTAVVDDVFEGAFDEIKYNWRTVSHKNYEERLTRDALMGELREEIEADVVRIIYHE